MEKLRNKLEELTKKNREFSKEMEKTLVEFTKKA
jgi:uncharacterized membrane-anchored protein